MLYYCTVHRNDVKNVLGDQLDAMTNHMVFDSGYDLDVMRDIVVHHPYKVIIEMERCATTRFGWKFARHSEFLEIKKEIS